MIILLLHSVAAADETAASKLKGPQADKSAAAAVEFFESRIRPVLVAHCYECHSAQSDPVQGGLRLDSATGLRQGGDSGPAISSSATQESLLLKALKYDGLEMPPSGRLSQNIIRDFEAWLKTGAVDPRSEDIHTVGSKPSGTDIAAGRSFWAFQPPRAAELRYENGAEVTDSARIDVLVRKRLAESSLTGNGPTDRRTLIRRMSFDLTGLPPTMEEVDAFCADSSETAVEQAADRLLDSTAYGERWARMWLDVVRYAEDQAHIVGSNKELFYPNAWKYRDWVVQAFNEDMPYDRFLTLQLAADLTEPNQPAEHVALGFIGLGPKYYRRNDPEVMAEEWEDRVDVVARGLQGLTVTCARCHDHKYDPIATEDYYALAGVFAGTDMFNQPFDGKEVGKNGQAKNPDESLHIVREAEPRDLAVMIRGDVNTKGSVVPRGYLQVMFPGDRRTFSDGSGRTELAAAVTDPQNPLTARVIVNRVWQQYFSRGIVATPSNFGSLGERPSHPELLDDLAVRFMQNGWSLKWLHRQIVLSDTYQQSSDLSASAMAVDPENKLLWRVPRRRLPIESWRDAVLSVSGTLDSAVGGPSMRPDNPDERRRTVYAEVSRFDLNPLLARFDFPDPNAHAERRTETNTPLQKLFLLNSSFMLKQSQAFTNRVLEQTTSITESDSTDSPDVVEHHIRTAFRLALQRQPHPEELAAAVRYIPKDTPEEGLQQVAQTLLAANEFWWLD
ncbi:MAG: PSD1 domain-containing protein [Planctomycetaceae bacterium]|nr:PSD1 domain-containing protein [Planctomycetaceae bacterium]